MGIEKKLQFNKTEKEIPLEREVESLTIENKQLREENKQLREENQQLREEKLKLEKDSIHDKLTGLKTREYFMGEANKNISTVFTPGSEKREEGFKHISFLFCDIDHFKKVNDTYGHPFGNEILKEVALLLEKNVRDSDTVCRWGGEEIVISLLGADEGEAAEKAEDLRKVVEEGIVQKYGIEYPDLKTSLSIGVSSFEPGLGVDELINRSDQAMYLAKEEGRNCVRTYGQFLEKKKEEIKVEF